MAETEYAPIARVDDQSYKFFAQLMNAWADSEGEEQEKDSDLLKEFKRYNLHFTDDAGKSFTLVSPNEFARAQEKIKKGEATDELLEPWIDAAIAAHNSVHPSSERIERATYQQSGWSKSSIIHDALFYAALPAFAHKVAEQNIN